MERKEIQEARMRSYFISATKEMIKGEGLKSVSVRSVSERAGYSYATLYNYFRDIKDLVFLCVQDFQGECSAYIAEETSGRAPGRERMLEKLLAFTRYFVQYPGIFELFYLERFGDLGHRQPTAGLICRFAEETCREDWAVIIREEGLRKEEASLRMGSLNSLLTGALLLYLNRRCPAGYQEFMKDLRLQLGQMI